MHVQGWSAACTGLVRCMYRVGSLHVQGWSAVCTGLVRCMYRGWSAACTGVGPAVYWLSSQLIGRAFYQQISLCGLLNGSSQLRKCTQF